MPQIAGRETVMRPTHAAPLATASAPGYLISAPGVRSVRGFLRARCTVMRSPSRLRLDDRTSHTMFGPSRLVGASQPQLDGTLPDEEVKARGSASAIELCPGVAMAPTRSRFRPRLQAQLWPLLSRVAHAPTGLYLLRWCQQPVDRRARPHKALRLIAEGSGLAGELGPAGRVSQVGAGVQQPVGNGDLLPGSSHGQAPAGGRQANAVVAVEDSFDAKRVVAPNGATGR
jgi:hypothetical protein